MISLMIAAALALAQPATATDGPAPPTGAQPVDVGLLRIEAGETVTLTLEQRADGKPGLIVTETSRTRDSGRSAGRVPENTVRFTVRRSARGSTLNVENGYDNILDYKAEVVWQDGKRQSSKVCKAVPGLPGLEMWSEPVTAIELSAFRLLPEGEAVLLCY